MTLPAAVSASRNEVRTVAPRLVELTETLVSPDIRERPGLSQARPELDHPGRPDHSLYAGWPSAMSAAKVVKQGYEEAKA